MKETELVVGDLRNLGFMILLVYINMYTSYTFVCVYIYTCIYNYIDIQIDMIDLIKKEIICSIGWMIKL